MSGAEPDPGILHVLLPQTIHSTFFIPFFSHIPRLQQTVIRANLYEEIKKKIMGRFSILTMFTKRIRQRISPSSLHFTPFFLLGMCM